MRTMTGSSITRESSAKTPCTQRPTIVGRLKWRARNESTDGPARRITAIAAAPGAVSRMARFAVSIVNNSLGVHRREDEVGGSVGSPFHLDHAARHVRVQIDGGFGAGRRTRA